MPAAWLLALLMAALQVPDRARVPNLDHQLVDPFQAGRDAVATVLVFTSIDCPISNRYAPEIRRVYEKFAPRGVRFWLVYPNPSESADAIRAHIRDFGYPLAALRDPKQDLVKLSEATVTPEAAVFDRDRRLVYHGRIDDRFVSLGVERPAATKHDLQEALTAMLAGKPVAQPATQAVGCFLTDFLR